MIKFFFNYCHKLFVLKFKDGRKGSGLGAEGAIADRGRQSSWGVLTQIVLLCRFIDELGLGGQLDGFLVDVQKEEGSFVEE